jgi:hypothetical protein
LEFTDDGDFIEFDAPVESTPPVAADALPVNVTQERTTGNSSTTIASLDAEIGALGLGEFTGESLAGASLASELNFEEVFQEEEEDFFAPAPSSSSSSSSAATGVVGTSKQSTKGKKARGKSGGGEANKHAEWYQEGQEDQQQHGEEYYEEEGEYEEGEYAVEGTGEYEEGELLYDENEEEDGELADEENTLPEHACAYCGLHNVSCVVRCNAPGCGKVCVNIYVCMCMCMCMCVLPFI